MRNAVSILDKLRPAHCVIDVTMFFALRKVSATINPEFRLTISFFGKIWNKRLFHTQHDISAAAPPDHQVCVVCLSLFDGSLLL